MGTAVHIRGAVKQYSSTSKVLKGLDMTVSKGSVYALLGASGCGKTTLLNCIVGRLSLNAGEISVLGGTPGSRNSGVPGPRIGYMPQDIGLIGEFSVEGALKYFGWLAGMNDKDIMERFDFLSRLLELPPRRRFVKNLSGGQQRRVSLAAALVHSAELLILDEPTVGLDPLLRQKIWDHLAALVQDHKVTVIITTHYIEEARQAQMVGLMRQGKLLAEHTPQCLLNFYSCSTLEEVFLKLSIRQSRTENEEDITPDDDVLQVQELPPALPEMELPVSVSEVEQPQPRYKPKHPKTKRMKALLTKNFLALVRNHGEIAMAICIPVIQITLFFFTIGRHPEGLHLAIVNRELRNYSNCSQYLTHENQTECALLRMSCKFLSKIEDAIAMKDYYHDQKMAFEAVRKGKAVAAMLFPSNFSEALMERWKLGRYTPNETVDASEVAIYMDMASQQLAITMQTIFFKEFERFGQEIAEKCDWNSNNIRIPMKFNKPLYGKSVPQYVDYVAPGFILTTVYFLATVLTTTVLIKDRLEGIWDRSLVAGVTSSEIVVSHVLSQCFYAIYYCAIVTFLSLYVFGLECKGSLFAFVLMLVFQAFGGMMFGLTVSTICSEYHTAIFLSVGSMMPFICLSGVVWPIEGMPYLLKLASYCMPYSIASKSLSYILTNGWSLLQPRVYAGYLISAGLSVVQFLFCIVMFHFRK